MAKYQIIAVLLTPSGNYTETECPKGYADYMALDKAYTATWNCPIYNWSARSAKIDYIYIEYMDGTTIEIEEKNLYLIGYF